MCNTELLFTIGLEVHGAPMTCKNLQDNSKTLTDLFPLQNQCSSNDTICNLGVCVPNYSTDSYTCHCPSTYTGANCETQVSAGKCLFATFTLLKIGS